MNSFSLLSLLLLPPLLCLSQPLNPDQLGLLVFKSSLVDPTSSLSSWSQRLRRPGKLGATTNATPNPAAFTSLNLSSLNLSGELGRGLLNVRCLQTLSLSDNNLTGPLNPSLAQLPNLTRIDFSRNGLSGGIPISFFSQCGGLIDVSLAGNSFLL
ncbi:uncharacterized protein A4U43_C02F3720 [Asparagus officinalis]|uniref:Leucine-rich repeat-containing N-terminal plant-type domain-containing protein n=1 Tax=Asparagus officinalis TaxID=4686 RepID=A0A5P1FKG3_ASPOF|nr:uncharacterized protein A4U43_C02F3720 [Asparagus officinalis]